MFLELSYRERLRAKGEGDLGTRGERRGKIDKRGRDEHGEG